jgi:peptide/nickel transport system substrate-binding protein
MYRNKLLVLISVLVVASMFLSACAPTPVVSTVEVVKTVVVTQEVMVAGTPQVQEVVVTATPEPTMAPTEPPPMQPTDTVVLALQQEPDTLHPGVGSMMARTIALAPIFVGCMSQNEKAEWVPLGCETVPTIDNGGAVFVGEGGDKHLEVTYKIRGDWRWTDGTPVTTKDILAWWKLNMDPEFEVASRVGIEKIYDFKVVDDKTVVAVWMSNNQAKEAEAGTLKGNVNFEALKDDYVSNAYSATGQPVVDPVYWTFIGWWPDAIVSQTPAKDQGASDFAKKPMGDGAYVVKEWKAGQELVLEKSDQPFPLGDPKIKTIVWRFIPDTKSVIAALQAGEIDATTSVAGLTPSDSPDLDKIAAGGIYNVWYFNEYSWEHIDLNTTKFPLDDPKVRQALYYAIDKQALIDTLYFGKYTPAELPGAILETNSQFYTPDYTKYSFDLDKAKQLLADAGWDCSSIPCTKTDAEGKTVKLEITLVTTDRADRMKLAQVIQSMWKQLNVGVFLSFLYGRNLFNPCSTGGPLYCRTFDAAIYTWVGGDDPGFWGLYNCTGIPTKENNWSGQNNPGWCNEAADKALNDAENNADFVVSPAKRKEAYDPFFKAWTDEVPVIPLFVNAVPIVNRVGFKNYLCGPTNAAPCGWNAWQWELSK